MIFRILLITISLISVNLAISVRKFDAQVNYGVLGESSTVYSTSVELWVELDDCTAKACKCIVQTNSTDLHGYFIQFLPNRPNIGVARIEYLNPATFYSFSLTCDGLENSVTRIYKTDDGRPSSPIGVHVKSAGNDVFVNWSAPQNPAGTIKHYRVSVNDKLINDRVTATYMLIPSNEFNSGNNQLFIEACNLNQWGNELCSSKKDGVVTYAVTTTTTVQTTTTTVQTTTATGLTPTTTSALVNPGETSTTTMVNPQEVTTTANLPGTSTTTITTTTVAGASQTSTISLSVFLSGLILSRFLFQ